MISSSSSSSLPKQRRIAVVVDGFNFVKNFNNDLKLTPFSDLVCQIRTYARYCYWTYERILIEPVVAEHGLCLFYPSPQEAFDKSIIGFRKRNATQNMLSELKGNGWEVTESSFKQREKGRWEVSGEDIHVSHCVDDFSAQVDDIFLVTSDQDHLVTLNRKRKNNNVSGGSSRPAAVLWAVLAQECFKISEWGKSTRPGACLELYRYKSGIQEFERKFALPPTAVPQNENKNRIIIRRNNEGAETTNESTKNNHSNSDNQSTSVPESCCLQFAKEAECCAQEEMKQPCKFPHINGNRLCTFALRGDNCPLAARCLFQHKVGLKTEAYLRLEQERERQRENQRKKEIITSQNKQNNERSISLPRQSSRNLCCMQFALEGRCEYQILMNGACPYDHYSKEKICKYALHKISCPKGTRCEFLHKIGVKTELYLKRELHTKAIAEKQRLVAKDDSRRKLTAGYNSERQTRNCNRKKQDNGECYDEVVILCDEDDDNDEVVMTERRPRIRQRDE